MLRLLHDLTTGSALLAEWPGPPNDATWVVHGDCGAYNTIFDDGLPVALIDWDSARPGDPLDDLALMTWTWCIQSAGNVAIADQARHVVELRDGYGTDLAPDALVDAVLRTQQRMVDVETRICTDPATAPARRAHAATAAAWADTDRDLLARHRAAFVDALGR